MLQLRMPIGLTSLCKQATHQLQSSIKLLIANSSSSSSSSSSSPSSSDSSDSSDSDLDKETESLKKKIDVQKNNDNNESIANSDVHQRLNNLLQKFQKSKNDRETKSEDTSKLRNFSIKPKKLRFKKGTETVPLKEQSFEQQLVGAAKNVATTIKGDTQKIQLELLSKVLNLDKSDTDKKILNSEAPASSTKLNSLISSMKIEHLDDVNKFNDNQKLIAKKLNYRFGYKMDLTSSSFVRSPSKHRVELKHLPFKEKIFHNLPKTEVDACPKLSTWKALEAREMRLAMLRPAQNIFQELINWTDKGKLWHFPINNEQGMEEESKVHFSEHVFMDRHLKDWCPKKGPIRHFMELVCVGLSKNPYMTVEEKVGHITWYKNYFEDKKDLLHELGVLDDNNINVKLDNVQQINP